jgi:hypothetical protein
MGAEHDCKCESPVFGQTISTRKQATAALSDAMMKGDVEAVLTALSRLDALPRRFPGARWDRGAGRMRDRQRH